MEPNPDLLQELSMFLTPESPLYSCISLLYKIIGIQICYMQCIVLKLFLKKGFRDIPLGWIDNTALNSSSSASRILESQAWNIMTDFSCSGSASQHIFHLWYAMVLCNIIFSFLFFSRKFASFHDQKKLSFLFKQLISVTYSWDLLYACFGEKTFRVRNS